MTRITLDTFLAWKRRKRQEKVAKAEEDMEKKKADFKAGRSFGVSQSSRRCGGGGGPPM